MMVNYTGHSVSSQGGSRWTFAPDRKPVIGVERGYHDAPRRGRRACIAAGAASTIAGLNPSPGARKVVRKATLEPDKNEIYAAYTLF